MLPVIPFEIAMLIDIESMLFVGMSTVLPSAVTRGTTRIHLLEGIRRIALSAGVLGSLVGFMMMLMNMSDPAAFLPSFQVAMLTSWYGVLVYAITSWLLRNTNEYQLSGVVRPSIIGSILVSAGSMYFLISYLNFGFIDFTTILLFVLGMPLIGLQRKKYPLSYRIFRSGITVGLFGMVFGTVQFINNMDDPSSIGPAMAIAILSSLYASVVVLGTATQIPAD